ncbi:MAG: hypothetical protein ACREV2_07370, partial [Burkholderiales bacterium]
SRECLTRIAVNYGCCERARSLQGLIGYRVKAQREGGEMYSALISNVRRGSGMENGFSSVNPRVNAA